MNFKYQESLKILPSPPICKTNNSFHPPFLVKNCKISHFSAMQFSSFTFTLMIFTLHVKHSVAYTSMYSYTQLYALNPIKCIFIFFLSLGVINTAAVFIITHMNVVLLYFLIAGFNYLGFMSDFCHFDKLSSVAC